MNLHVLHRPSLQRVIFGGEGEVLGTFFPSYLKKSIKIGFPELEKNFLQLFRSFFVK